MTILILLLIGGGLYFSTSEERKRVLRALDLQISGVKKSVGRMIPEREPFADTLRERTPIAVVTPILVVLNVAMFTAMLTSGSPANPDTLLGWGATFGPRTTNGEWWRLVTAMFVHTGFLHVAINMAGLLQVGLILERLFGRLAFAGVFLAAGLFSNLIGLAAHPVLVSAGASGAIFGVYGLLIAWLVASWVFGSTVTMPYATIKRIGPAAAVFFVYSLLAGFGGAAETAGLFVGVGYGLVLARGASESVPARLRVGIPMAAVVVLIVTSAVPLRGMANVTPEIERMTALEDEATKTYEHALHQLTRGAATMDELTQLIEQNILPGLTAAHARLTALQRVPREQVAIVTAANEYFQLREESWRVRAEGLRRSNSGKLRDADRAERASRDVLDKITATEQK